MSNETRLMLIGFISTPMAALAMVGTYWLAHGWKLEAPWASPFWVLPGQLASIVLIAVGIWWWHR